MKVHLQLEIDHLKNLLCELAATVEPAVREAVRAVETRDAECAQQVLAGDEAIDRMEVRIEEECLKVLALHQPVAGDLRYVITLLKVNSELERIGDLAVNIAERGADLATLDAPQETLDFSRMVFEARSMLKNALDALICRNAVAAQEVIQHDDVVDDLHHEALLKLRELISRHPEYAAFYLDLLTVSRNLERIADGATNICEDVIYLELGTIVRHNT